MRTRYLLFSLLVLVLIASCATPPAPAEPEEQPEAPAAPAPAEPAPAEPAPAEPAPAEPAPAEPAPAEPAPAEPEAAPTPPPAARRAPAPAPAAIPTSWEAVDVEARLNGRPYRIPDEYLGYRVIGTFGERDLTIEVPELDFRIYAVYDLLPNGLHRVSVTGYENVPPGIQELAMLAEQEIGGPLPDDYYFEVELRDRQAIVEADALGFSASSTWVPVR